jgi:hypothetical protein
MRTGHNAKHIKVNTAICRTQPRDITRTTLVPQPHSAIETACTKDDGHGAKTDLVARTTERASICFFNGLGKSGRAFYSPAVKARLLKRCL